MRMCVCERECVCECERVHVQVAHGHSEVTPLVTDAQIRFCRLKEGLVEALALRDLQPHALTPMTAFKKFRSNMQVEGAH